MGLGKDIVHMSKDLAEKYIIGTITEENHQIYK